MRTILKFPRKYNLIWTCPKDFCANFFFHRICNVIPQNLLCYGEWNSQLINYYLKHDTWVYLILTLSWMPKAFKICFSWWEATDIAVVFLIISRIEILRASKHESTSILTHGYTYMTRILHDPKENTLCPPFLLYYKNLLAGYQNT